MFVKFKRKGGDENPKEDIDSEINDEEIEGLEDQNIEDEKPDSDEDFDSQDEIEDDEEDLVDEKPVRSAFWDIIKDVAIAFIIVILIISSIYIYTGNWPPVVVVESDSMQHSDTEGFLGVIDTGDLVLVKAIESEDDIVSYMKGKRIGHETYSEYGDVLIYRKNGFPQSKSTPVIHRALIWLEYNETSKSFDIPELKYHNAGSNVTDEWYVISGENRWYNLSGSIVLKDIGYDHDGEKDIRNVMINLGAVLGNYENNPDIEPHSGFITLGDHNSGRYDQSMLPAPDGGKVRPIKPEWVVGVARGELPWFGLIKLYFQDNTITERAPSNSFTMLWISLILIFAVPISIDIILILYERRKERLMASHEDFDDEKEVKEEEKPPPDDFEEDDLPPPDD